VPYAPRGSNRKSRIIRRRRRRRRRRKKKGERRRRRRKRRSMDNVEHNTCVINNMELSQIFRGSSQRNLKILYNLVSF
jgi:hypothetical protein